MLQHKMKRMPIQFSNTFKQKFRSLSHTQKFLYSLTDCFILVTVECTRKCEAACKNIFLCFSFWISDNCALLMFKTIIKILKRNDNKPLTRLITVPSAQTMMSYVKTTLNKWILWTKFLSFFSFFIGSTFSGKVRFKKNLQVTSARVTYIFESLRRNGKTKS